MIYPTFAALFTDSTIFEEGGDVGPVANAVFDNEKEEYLVFDLCPLAFDLYAVAGSFAFGRSGGEGDVGCCCGG